MSPRKRSALIATALLLALLAIYFLHERRSELTVGGGPRGGTFQNVASGVTTIVGRQMPEVRIKVRRTGGSITNLTEVNKGKMDMALVFAGDAYLGYRGELDEKKTTDVLALARLYSAAAHLVVLKDSRIRSPSDLKDRRVAIGTTGSGSALSARRYFGGLKLWDEITPIYVGEAMSVRELKKREVEAVWTLVGVPNLFLRVTSRKTPIRFIDTLAPETSTGFLQAYPFYSAVRVPAGTYQGQDRDVLTYQDATLLVVNRHLSMDLVESTLQALFSEEGLDLLRGRYPATSDLEIGSGLQGVKIPLHPGAEKFWREQGRLPSPR